MPNASQQHWRRPAATTGLVATTALAATFLALLSPPTLAAARAPGADVSALVAGVAVGLGWLMALRLLVTTVGVLAASLPGVVGAIGRRVARAASPRLVRSLVHVACGMSVAAAPLSAGGTAFADPPHPASDSSRTPSSVRLVEPPVLPVLDRVVVAPTSTPTTAPTTEPARRVVVVRSGDSLWSLAAEHLGDSATDAQVARTWPRWYAANAETIGPDPGVIHPGEHLVVPDDVAEAAS